MSEDDLSCVAEFTQRCGRSLQTLRVRDTPRERCLDVATNINLRTLELVNLMIFTETAIEDIRSLAHLVATVSFRQLDVLVLQVHYAGKQFGHLPLKASNDPLWDAVDSALCSAKFLDVELHFGVHRDYLGDTEEISSDTLERLLPQASEKPNVIFAPFYDCSHRSRGGHRIITLDFPLQPPCIAELSRLAENPWSKNLWRLTSPLLSVRKSGASR